MEKFLKKSGWTSILSSIIFAILGIIVICHPETTLKVITGILGAMFIIIGIARIIAYFVAKGNYDFLNYDLIYGLIAIILGVITIGYSSAIETLFRIMIGAWIIYSSLMRLGLSIKLNKAKSKSWIYVMTIALLMLICGLYIIFNKGTIIVTIGIIMLIYAIMDIIEGFIFIKNVDEIFD